MKASDKKSVFTAAVVVMFAMVLRASPVTAGFYVIPVKTGSKNTVVVKHEGTDEESGAALLAAMEKITDASDTNRYLIVIEPGTYDIGTESLQMKQYVDVSGWGEDETVITGSVVTSASTPDTGVVKGACESELLRLTVQNTGTGANAVAVYVGNFPALCTSPFIMRNVKIIASGGTNNYGCCNIGVGVTMYFVNVDARDGTGNNYGVYQDGGTTVTYLSVIAGQDYSIYNNSGSFGINHSYIINDIYGFAVCKCVCDASQECSLDECPPFN